jgi:hypothetical protein
VLFNQNLGALASARSSTTQHCARYVLRWLMIDRRTVSALAAELGVHPMSWSLGGLTLIIDLTPAHDRCGPWRLLGLVSGR